MTTISQKSIPVSARSARATSSALLAPPPWAVLALIALVTCWAYWPVLQGGLLWDDEAHVTRPSLQSAEGLVRIWLEPGATQQFYPLLHSFFWLQHKLWGDNTLGYHIVNLLLHLAAAGLVYLILQRLQVPGALLATAVFALHPVHVETVAWITEQKNTLSAVFYLGAMLAYLHFDENRRGSWYALALGLFVLGLLSKTVTATLPAALLVIFWWQRGSLSWRRDLLPLLPFFALGAAGGIFTAWFERKLIGAEGDEFNLTLIERGLLAGRVVWFYLAKLCWPSGLSFFYPRWDIDAGDWRQWLYPLSALFALGLLWAVRGRARAPLAAALLFVGTLFPVLGFLNVYPFRFSFVADHFQYLASLGPIVLVAAAISTALARSSPQARSVGTVGCAVLVGVLAFLSRQQTPMYVDADTLYQSTILRNPDCWLAYNNLGATLTNRGQTQDAIGHFETALRLNPDYPDALNNLGKALLITGHHQESIPYFEKAVRLKPNSHQSLNNLGNALLNTGRPQEAIKPLEESVRLNPYYADARVNLGVAKFKVGQPQEAIAQLEEAVKLRPDLPEAQCNLGGVLFNLGRPQDALGHLKEAVSIKPNYLEAWANLALANVRLGHAAEAIAAAEKAIELARRQGESRLAAQMETLLQELRAQAKNPPADILPPALPPP